MARENCKEFLQYEHTSKNFFILAHVYWFNQFLEKYPNFCTRVADQYSTYHYLSQRMSQVKIINELEFISRQYTEDDIFSNFHQEEDNFGIDMQDTKSINLWQRLPTSLEEIIGGDWKTLHLDTNDSNR